MPAPQDITDRILRNLVLVQRLGTSVAAQTQPLLDALFDQLAEDLRRIDPAGPALLKWRQYRTETFVSLVQERVAALVPEWEKAVKAALAEIGRSQAVYAQATLVVSLGDVGRRVTATPITQARLRTILNSKPFQGALLREHAETLGATTVNRIRTQVRLGMQAEESIPDLVRRVRGTQAGFIRRDPVTGAFVSKGTRGAVVSRRWVGGVWDATTRDAEAVVRTAVNFVSNEGAVATYQENARLLEGMRFSAQLDDRTTELCGSLDNNLYAMDDTAIPVPPLHFQCRSTLVPEPDYEAVGLTPPDDGERVARDLSDVEDLDRKVSARRSSGDLGKNVRVPSSTTYADWLKSQPVRVQERVLGRGKARLFREGEITLKDMVRRDRSIVPLRELLDELGGGA